jgi:hypothetical protein
MANVNQDGEPFKSTAAGRCYDCGKDHPAWVEDLLDRMWNDDYVWTPEEEAKMNAFSKAEHPDCFK